VTGPAERRSEQAARLARDEEARVAALAFPAGAAGRLDGRAGAILTAVLAQARRRYRQLRAAVRLPT
jgi:hypothetical protein